MKKGARIHRLTADKKREMKEPVIAFDVSSPRRIKMWEMAKQKDAWREKYSLIRHPIPEENPAFEQVKHRSIHRSPPWPLCLVREMAAGKGDLIGF
jgi:hypothetical protein